ncbi:hypothetical protein, partial [Thiolapillus sp.]|uniref:hypothetical protein n=1 Tax=Thiolapillus sp. TaxID=2017437 RepID=UPI003AF9CD89
MVFNARSAPEGHARAIYQSSNPKQQSDSMFITLSLSEEDLEKMKLNEPGRQKVEGKNSRQLVKHAKLHSDLLQALKNET